MNAKSVTENKFWAPEILTNKLSRVHRWIRITSLKPSHALLGGMQAQSSHIFPLGDLQLEISSLHHDPTQQVASCVCASCSSRATSYLFSIS